MLAPAGREVTIEEYFWNFHVPNVNEIFGSAKEKVRGQRTSRDLFN